MVRHDKASLLNSRGLQFAKDTLHGLKAESWKVIKLFKKPKPQSRLLAANADGTVADSPLEQVRIYKDHYSKLTTATEATLADTITSSILHRNNSIDSIMNIQRDRDAIVPITDLRAKLGHSKAGKGVGPSLVCMRRASLLG